MGLSNEETDIRALWLGYRSNGDQESRNLLAEHYLYLINIIAGRIAINLPTHVDRDDLISSGFFGLMDAIERYDIDKENKFETYASIRIRGAILDYLRSKDWIPVSLRQKIRRYEQAVAALEGMLGRSATDEEIAAEMNISAEELANLVKQLNVSTVIPLEDYLRLEVGTDDEGESFTAIEADETRKILAQAIDELPEKERQVVSLYYYDEMTLKEISLILHLSEARISQLHTKAVFRLRGHLLRIKNSLL